MRVAIYCRVSSDEQAEKGTSLKAQEEVLIKHCQTLNFTIADVYIDDGYSAATPNRPAFQRLLRDAHLQKFDKVLVTKTDRFARNQGDALYIIDKEFHPYKVQLLSLAEPFDHREPTGKLQFGIHAGFAEYERAVIRDRTVAGRRKRAAEGKCMVNTQLLGYARDKENNWLIDQKGAKIYYDIVRWLVDESLTTRQIAGKLNTMGIKTPRGKIWNRTTISRMLRNRTYLGEGRYGPVTYKMHALIDEYRFSQIAKALDKNRVNTKPSNRHVSVLKGLIRCGACNAGYGLHVTVKPNGRTFRYYLCGSYYNAHGLYKKPCPSQWVKYEEVVHAVRERVKRALTSQQFINELLADQTNHENGASLNYEAEKIIADKAVRDKQVQVNRIFELYSKSNIDRALLGQQITKFQQELAEAAKVRDDLVCKINDQKHIFQNITQIKAEVERIGQRLDQDELPDVEIQKLFKKIIASVTVRFNPMRKRYAYLIKTKWEVPQRAPKALTIKSKS